MAWLEIKIDTLCGSIDAVATALTAGGFEDLVLEDQQEFETFLDQNRAYWDYIDEDLQEKLRRIGMYKTKARNIKKLAQMLVEKYDGQVPEDDKLLQELPGVGRKTANVVMAVGFGHQRIAVDTHVFRVSNRIGLVSEKDVLKTELALMETLPEERWSRSHHSLIFHGRYCCAARKPVCSECPISHICKKVGVE